MTIDLSDSGVRDQLTRIFMPFAMERTDALRARNGRFAYYTSAETGIGILRGNRVWLRNARLMNDFREIQHGHDCLVEAWKDQAAGGRFKALLDSFADGLSTAVEHEFDSDQHATAASTFLLSISEHGGESEHDQQTIDEDLYGRLSMWRAYGGDTNVAFIFRNAPFVTDRASALGSYTSPVLYGDAAVFKAEFQKVISSIERHSEFVRQLPPDELKAIILHVLRAAMLSTKHKGFHEEREWRVIYRPVPGNDRIEENIEVVSGVPQRVCKIPLADNPEAGVSGIRIADALDRIIIGPTLYPWPIAEAFISLLHDCGVPEPHTRVRVSDIPLRR